MDEILRQLVPLLIGSVPTILIFIFLVISYKFILHEPLLKMLAERRLRTAGAVERAQAAIAAADAKTQEYEAKLRAARAEIYRARENRVKAWTAERESALNDTRQVARTRAIAEKAAIEAQAAASRLDIERAADGLAADILRAVLPAGLSSSASANPIPAEGAQ